jgi:hypothetical protein
VADLVGQLMESFSAADGDGDGQITFSGQYARTRKEPTCVCMQI